MTDIEITADLARARTALAVTKTNQLKEETATVIALGAVVVARNAWVEFINNSQGLLDNGSDETQRELARCYLELEQMVERMHTLMEKHK
jgi:hypothetical protein